ncbi:MAG: glycine cleavage system protein GcvH [Oceanococcaceae bacterium]
MAKVPEELKYTKSHEWLRVDDDVITVGITDHAQDALGDLVYVEVPETGRAIEAGEACAVVESVKAASDVYAPVTGEVIEGNSVLAEAPETINDDAYGAGWMFKIRGSIEGVELLDAAAYSAFVAENG